MDTLLLDVDTWDLVVDVSSNIAMASDPYAIAQDAASAIKLVRGELWYDTTQGVPYSTILGQLPALSYVKDQFVLAAETVPEVTSATVFISGFEDRILTGQVQVATASGATAAANF
jgi:hypothetical protein